jgi:hypothetical protein
VVARSCVSNHANEIIARGIYEFESQGRYGDM